MLVTWGAVGYIAASYDTGCKFWWVSKLTEEALRGCKLLLGAKKPINRKHINIFLTALGGQSSQGRTSTRSRDKRDKWRFYCGIQQRKASLSQGRVPFCPGEGSHLSQGRFLFVPDTVPPKNVYVYWFFSCPILGLPSLQECAVKFWLKGAQRVDNSGEGPKKIWTPTPMIPFPPSPRLFTACHSP